MDDLRDDRLLAPTKWAVWAIVPVLVTAFVVLFGFPGRTKQLWAWTIDPKITALFMGAGYLSGAYFFARVALSGCWHRAGAVFIAISVFTTVLLGATALHWDRFNHAHVAFWFWIGLYATTPVLLPWLWANNRRTDPGDTVEGGHVRVPRPLRLLIGAGGSLMLLAAAAMFLFPARAADVWPWKLPPLSARALSAYLAFAAMTWVWFLVEDRWASLRTGQETVALAFVLNVVGALRAHDDFRSGPWFGLYVAALLAGLAMSVALIVGMERFGRSPRRSARRPPRDAEAAGLMSGPLADVVEVADGDGPPSVVDPAQMAEGAQRLYHRFS